MSRAAGRALEGLADRDLVGLDLVAEVLALFRPETPLGCLPELIELGSRLPSGLIHAEAIWALAEQPSGLVPLAAGSPWCAADRSLVVVIPAGRRGLSSVFEDLARYHVAAMRVKAQLAGRPDLLDALAGDVIPVAAAAELSVLLDAPPSAIASLDRVAPGLRADLRAMAGRSFAPPIRVHRSLRPSELRQKGARIAAEILSRIPQGGFRLLISDSRTALEHLSPYVRDLGHALAAWGLENAAALRTEGLADALQTSAGDPKADLAALVARDLFAAAPDLLSERREAELSAGLHLWDEDDTAYGWAELSRLALPDDVAVHKGASGTLAVIAGGADEILREGIRVLLEAGRVSGAAFVLGTGIDAGEAILADALVDDDDAMRVASSSDLAERAARVGLAVHRLGAIPVDLQLGAPPLLAELLGLVRRAGVNGRLPEDAPTYAVLYPRPRKVAPLGVRLAEIDAGRLALSALSAYEDRYLPRARRLPSQNAPSISRRFRA